METLVSVQAYYNIDLGSFFLHACMLVTEHTKRILIHPYVQSDQEWSFRCVFQKKLKHSIRISLFACPQCPPSNDETE